MKNISIILRLFLLIDVIDFQSLYAEENNNIPQISNKSTKENVSEKEIKLPNEYTRDQVIKDKDLTIDAKSRIPINGVVKEFYESSHALKSIIEYKNGKLNGSSKGYFANGKLQVEGKFINGDSEGILKEYYESGKLFKEIAYKNTKPEGIVKIYYEKSGKLKAEMFYKEGKLEGQFKIYYESGKINEINIYKNGKLEGIRKIYSEETEKMTQEIQYKNDLQDGIFRDYYENGALNHEFKIKNGKINGDYFVYLENGKLCGRLIYKDDHAISGKKSNGKKLNKAELLSFDNNAPVNCD